MPVSPTHIPSRLKPCVFCYSEEDLRTHLELPEGSKYADDYGHSTMCVYFLIERKSNANISNAIVQLETTFKAIKEKHLELKEVIIMCSGLSKSSSRIYTVKTKQLTSRIKGELSILYDKERSIPIYCCNDENYPIIVEYTK